MPRTLFNLLVGLFLALPLAMPAGAVPLIGARAAILIDGDTGQILYGVNPHEQRAPASTTKVMSSLVALTHGKLTDLVTVSERASGIEGSSIYLEKGEKLSLEQLLYGVLLESGNDATAAVAEHIGGSVPGFVKLMNEKAMELGLKDTHFSNPHGLPAKDHYTSAYDLAMITKEALSNPTFAMISGTRTKNIPGNGKIKVRTLFNHNKLLNYFPGATGGKTGYTSQAGRCFVGSARRNGRFVIEVILDSPTMWKDAEALLNYGLDEFNSYPVAAGGSVFGTVRVTKGNARAVKGVVNAPLFVSVPKGIEPQVTTQVDLSRSVEAPVKAGQVVGHCTILNGNVPMAVVPLRAAEDVPLAPPIWRFLSGALEWIFRAGLFALTLFSLFHLHGIRRKRRLRNRTRPPIVVVPRKRRPKSKTRGLALTLKRITALLTQTPTSAG